MFLALPHPTPSIPLRWGIQRPLAMAHWDLARFKREAIAIFATVCGDAEYMTKEQVHVVALAAGMPADTDWETEYATMLASHHVDATRGWTVVKFAELLEEKWGQFHTDVGRAWAQRALLDCVLRFRTPDRLIYAVQQALAPQRLIHAVHQAPAQAVRLEEQAQQAQQAQQALPGPQDVAPLPLVVVQPAPPPGPPPPALPPVARPRAQPPAQHSCGWHRSLAECEGVRGLTGFGDGRQLPVSPVAYNEYSNNVTRLLALNTHLENTLFFEDQRGWQVISEQILRCARDGDLSVVACRTQANRFVKYECTRCSAYVRALHSTWELPEDVARARRSVLYFFKFSNETDPQPGRPSV